MKKPSTEKKGTTRAKKSSDDITPLPTKSRSRPKLVAPGAKKSASISSPLKSPRRQLKYNGDSVPPSTQSIGRSALSANRHASFHTIGELRAYLDQVTNLEAISHAYCLSTLVRGALPSPNFTPPEELANLIYLNPWAEEFLQRDLKLRATHQEAELKFAALASFAHHDILLDVDKCDLAGIELLLAKSLRNDFFRLPWIFGQTLYMHFAKSCANHWIDHIPAEEAWSFLDRQPKGMSQMGNLIFGPLGITHSSQKRHLPITRNLPLWHCSDAGCMASHNVELLLISVGYHKALDALETNLNANFGQRSHWAHVLNSVIEGPTAPTARRYYDIACVIADCLTNDERKLLFERTLQGETAQVMRARIREIPEHSKLATTAPSAIAAALSPETQLQMLWMLGDDQLVNLLDRAVLDKAITIPPNEERNSTLSPPKRSFVERASVLSSLGVKERVESPLVSLCSVIWGAYEQTNNLPELSWRIRGPDGIATKESLMQFIRREEPADTVAKLILASGPITEIVTSELRYCGGLEGPDLTAHLLWKFGFNVPRYSDTYSIFRSRIGAFQEALLGVGVIKNEADREKIRAVGVNLFVSLEQILDELISYNVWLLGTDHFMGSHNIFCLNEAREAVSNILGEQLESGSEVVRWNKYGGNTLGTLLRYLNETASWTKSLLSTDSSKYERPETDMPHYADFIEREFVFRHTVFWADVIPARLTDFANDFSTLVHKIAQAEITAIRNGLDHQRTPAAFPEANTMHQMIAKVKDAFDHADYGRYLPKEFWFESLQNDRYGRSEIVFKDYEGRRTTITLPEFTEGTRGLDRAHAVVIPPGALLGQHAALTFAIHDQSDFSSAWREFPIRRTIE